MKDCIIAVSCSILLATLASVGYLAVDYRQLNRQLIKVHELAEGIRLERETVAQVVRSGESHPLLLSNCLDTLQNYCGELRDIQLQEAGLSLPADLENTLLRLKNLIRDEPSVSAAAVEMPPAVHQDLTDATRQLESLQKQAEQTLIRMQARADLRLHFSFVVLTLGLSLVLFLLYRKVVMPLWKLDRQVEEIHGGERREFDVSSRHRSIENLVKFANTTLHGLHAREEELRRHRRMMHATSDRQAAISRILELSATTTTMEELLERILESILALDKLKIENRGGILMVDPDDPSMLVLKAQVNFSPALLSTCSRVPMGRCLCGRAAVDRSLVYAADIDERHEIRYPEMTSHGHYCVPILFGEELLGVMVLYLPPSLPRDQERENFLADVASVLAEAMARRRLEEQQQLISTAVDQVGEGIVVADKVGKILYANPYMENLTGFNADELLGRNIIALLREGDESDHVPREMWKAVRSGETWEGVAANQRKSGETYEERMVVTPVRDRDGKVCNIVAIKKDITIEKSLEKQLLQSQKMESVGRLAGGVAHDFNNILTAIISYSELAMLELDQEHPVQSQLSIIEESGRKAAALTRQLLAFSRNQPLQMQSHNINDIVNGLSRMLHRLIGEDIELELKTGDDAIILADGGQIEQVLMNLVVNAGDAMPNGGRLRVETARVNYEEEFTVGRVVLPPGEYVMVAVSDTGVGMTPELQEKIFDPFFTTKNPGKGTGLGLSMVYGIVTQHDGRLVVESEPGRGTTMKVFLPVAAGRRQQAKELAENRLPSGKETILLVEDEANVLLLIGDILQPLGYNLLTAGSGQDALRISEAYPGEIHLLLTDVVMPGINGRELAAALQQQRPDIKIVYMSGYPDDVLAGKAALDPEMELINKPLSPGMVARKLREVLDSPQ